MAPAARLSNGEIKEATKNLTAAAGASRWSDARALLEKLQSGVTPTEEVIRATKVGQAVAKLRSAEDKVVAQMAKELVRTWKSKVDSQRELKKKDSPAASGSPSTAVASPQSIRASAAPTPTAAAAASSKKDPLNFEVLKDRTRDACLKLIHQSLETDNNGTADIHTIYDRALSVEAAVLKQIGKGAVTAEYRAKVRTLTAYLKDKKNPSLRAKVVSGQVAADKLVVMTPDEMASEEQKAERDALQMQNLFNAKAAAPQEAETDAFQCGKCKQRKCRYYQKQTRSADEPMTTFVTCTSCNHRWKFC